jgi:hypothetical protein
MATNIVDVAEQKRLNEAREAGIPWKKWGPYLSERQWGTVREDYSDNGDAWNYFTRGSGPATRRVGPLWWLPSWTFLGVSTLKLCWRPNAGACSPGL